MLYLSVLARAVIRRAPAARAFSTTTVAHSENESEALLDAAALMHQAGDASPTRESDVSQSPPDMSLERHDEADLDLKPFAFKSVLRPYQLTYRARQKSFFSKSSPPLIGPSRKQAQHKDIFHKLKLDPVDFACTPAVLNRFLTNMGKINSRAETGLTRKSQRRLGKAVRRARMMGIIPSFSQRKSVAVNPASSSTIALQ